MRRVSGAPKTITNGALWVWERRVAAAQADRVVPAHTDEEALGVALTRMVDPLTVIRTAVRSSQEGMADGADPSEDIAAIRRAAAKLNTMLVDLRTRYPHPAP